MRVTDVTCRYSQCVFIRLEKKEKLRKEREKEKQKEEDDIVEIKKEKKRVSVGCVISWTVHNLSVSRTVMNPPEQTARSRSAGARSQTSTATERMRKGRAAQTERGDFRENYFGK